MLVQRKYLLYVLFMVLPIIILTLVAFLLIYKVKPQNLSKGVKIA